MFGELVGATSWDRRGGGQGAYKSDRQKFGIKFEG